MNSLNVLPATPTWLGTLLIDTGGVGGGGGGRMYQNKYS